jgi:hypothetical protein
LRIAKLTSESATSPEALGDALDLQDLGAAVHATFGASSSASSRWRTAEGRMPAGRKSIITTIAEPEEEHADHLGVDDRAPEHQRCAGSTV